MTDLEAQLHDHLHALGDGGYAMSGPALRRRARTRQLTMRGGSVVALGAAGTAAALVVPGLLTSPPGTNTGIAGAVTPKASAAAPTKVAAPAPSASAVAKPVPSSAAAATPSSVPVQANAWSPAGSLIDEPTVRANAPKVAATDSDWTSWTKDYDEGPLLAQDTVSVVYAGEADILSSGAPGPRPLVVVTGRTSQSGPLQIVVLTSVAGAKNPTSLDSLAVEAMHPAAAQGPQAIAVFNGVRVYVAAQDGVDSATFTWRDDAGTHSAPMTVTDGVATAPVPALALKKSSVGAVTNIRAMSHGTVVWDAAPIDGR